MTRRILFLSMIALLGVATGLVLTRSNSTSHADPPPMAALHAIQPNAPSPSPPSLLPPTDDAPEDTAQDPEEDDRSVLLNAHITVQPPPPNAPKTPNTPPAPSGIRRPNSVPTRTIHDPVSTIRTFLQTEDATQRYSIASTLQNELGVQGVLDTLPAALPFEPIEPQILRSALRVGDVDIPYILYIPRRYDPSKAWPMHVHLHGGGSTVTGERSCLKNWGRQPLGRMLLLCPSVPHGRWWRPENDAALMGLVRNIIQTVHVDTDRISVGGISNGGNGTWHMGAKYPWMWSTLIPRCAAGVARHDIVRNMRQLSAFIIHGARDRTIHPKHSRNMHKALRRARIPVKYLEIEDGGHEYFPEHNREARPWIMRKKRPIRSAFHYSPLPGNDPGLIHWIYAPGLSSPLKASIQKHNTHTTITLDAESLPPYLTVYLPRQHVDLKKPVHITSNNRSLFKGTVQPSVWNVLTSYDLTRDQRRIFDAAVHLNLAGEHAPL